MMEPQEPDKNAKFKSLKGIVSSTTLKAIKSMGFKYMTDIQSEVLCPAMEGTDIVATAKTGSGKTLAFLIPVVETVVNNRETLPSGAGSLCIIISPTRELATQTYTVLQEIIAHHDCITTSLIIGGESRKKQSMELSNGIHIVVATPGRLFDHMRSKEFDYRLVKCLVLDEADKIFQYGFEEDLKQIVERLPKERQTMLFSATISERTEALIKSALKENYQTINTSEDNTKATVDGLKQGYAICETEYRLWWLHKMLKKMQNQKVMVFFSSCKSVVFHHEFFNKYCNMPVLCIHGKMNQADRTATMTNFYNAEKVALFCTDLAARGLDIPAVDWIVQFDPPSDTNLLFIASGSWWVAVGERVTREIFDDYIGRLYIIEADLIMSSRKQEYIHRVGRTARGTGTVGNAVLLLRPEEIGFVDHLKEAKVYLDKYESWNTFSNLQPKLDVAFQNTEFHTMAVEAFEGYIRALEVRKLKQIFNLITMDLDKVAKSFGLKEKPDVDIHIGFSKKHRPRKRMADILATKNGEMTKRKKSLI